MGAAIHNEFERPRRYEVNPRLLQWLNEIVCDETVPRNVRGRLSETAEAIEELLCERRRVAMEKLNRDERDLRAKLAEGGSIRDLRMAAETLTVTYSDVLSMVDDWHVRRLTR